MSFTITFEDRSITLRNPEFSNTYTPHYRIIQRESRGRTLITTKATGFDAYKRYEKYVVSFQYLKQSEVTALLQLLHAATSRPVTIVDHEDVTISAVILTPEAEVAQIGRNNFTVSFEYEKV